MNRQERLDKITNQLKGVIQEDQIPVWLDTPSPAFGNRKPKNIPISELQRIIKRTIYYLESGMPM